MPTIDQLAPATAASDNDKLLVSQQGVTRAVTRAQILAGVQPQLALKEGTLLGRSSVNTGTPEQITVGANLSLDHGVLSAAAASFDVRTLSPGTVPSGSDLIPLAQDGQHIAVTYDQFMSGLAGASSIDGSKLLVTPSNGKPATRLSDLAANTLPTTGGYLTGALFLPADPSALLQATTKRYVDTQVATALPKAGGTLTGGLSLPADPTTALQAATKQYVDTQVGTTVPKAGGTLTGAITLPADPSTALQATTKQYVDKRLLRTGDTLTGPLLLAADPTATLQAATKGYVDGQVAAALPKSGGTLTGALTLPGDPTTALHAATKSYVDAKDAATLPKTGGTLTGALTLAANPTVALHAAPKQYVDSQVASAVPLAGGTMTGALTLPADPTSPLHAATKRYVDSLGGGATGVINVRSYNAQLNGVTDDTAAFKAAYQAAPAGSVIYVPNGVTVLQPPQNWGIPLTKRVKWAVDGTTLSDGTCLANGIPNGAAPASNYLPGLVVGNSRQSVEFSQTGSDANDYAVLHTSYIVGHNGGPPGGVISNARHDTIIYNSPGNYVWGSVDRLLWCGQQAPAGSTAEHVARYVQTIRQNVGTDGNGTPLPQPHLWAACLEYRDVTGRPSSAAAAAITVEMDWFGNGPDDGAKRQIQSLVIGQHDTGWTPVEVSTIIGVYLAGGCAGHAHKVFHVGVPFSISALDTSDAQQLPGAHAIRLAAGHSIAFEASGQNRLAYDSAAAMLRWHQGGLSYPVGKGITVGWQNVFTGNTTVPSYISGNLIFLAGSGPYTVTLPPSGTVAPGTGFTFSAVCAGPVTIAPASGESIENGPITLRANDRYHIVSDGGGGWREIFRTNAVNPRFTGPPVLPSYSVATLPSSPGTGGKAFVSNGRKPFETAGAGTGVEAFYDGARWVSVCDALPVLA